MPIVKFLKKSLFINHLASHQRNQGEIWSSPQRTQVHSFHAVALLEILARHKKTIEINGLSGFGGHNFFCTADTRAEATPTELAAFDSGPGDRNHPWDAKLPNDEASIELISLALCKLMADLKRDRP